MKNKFLRAFTLFCFLAGSASFGSPEAKLTVRTVDGDGVALGGLSVIIGFWNLDRTHTEINGETNTNGMFSAEGKAESWDAYYLIRNHGYYDSEEKYVFADLKGGKWQPWNPVVTAVVRRVVNPIPMYAKRIETVLPTVNAACGYDLKAGDWVAPYGRGECSDLVFRVDGRRVVSWTDCDGSLAMSFSRQKDGFQIRNGIKIGGSSFPWPYLAPEDGYTGNASLNMGYAPLRGLYSSNETAACFLRVRTVTNEYGRIISAHYGKVPGPIKFDVREGKSGWIGFTYYLNPTPNDRNLEFDPKRNLFQNLKSTERVNMP